MSGENYVKIENYIINPKHLIGKGSWSKVYSGLNTINNTEVAVKIINMQKIQPAILNRLKSEIDILSCCSHPNILYMEKTCNDSKYLYLITELCDGTLYDLMRNGIIPEIEVQYYMRQIKEGLQYLYNKNITHRDLKPQNILIKYNNSGRNYKNIVLKIADFGLAKVFENETDIYSTVCGSPIYLAPEVYNGSGSSKSDLWSIGILIYQMLFGKIPYKNCKNIKDIMTQQHNIIEIPSADISIECVELLTKLLSINMDTRIDWNDFFNHEWFNDLEDTIFQSTFPLIKNDVHIEREIIDDGITIADNKVRIVDDYVDKMSSTISIPIPICKPLNTIVVKNNNSVPSPLYNSFNTFYRLMSSGVDLVVKKIQS